MGTRSKQRQLHTVWVEAYCMDCIWSWLGTDPVKGLELAEAHSAKERHTVFAGEPGGLHGFIPRDNRERAAEVMAALHEAAQEGAEGKAR